MHRAEETFKAGSWLKRLTSFAWAVVLAGLLSPATAAASSFSNPGAIAIPIPGQLRGPASPYPSTIEVSGLPGTVVKARATLHGVIHLSSPADINVLLVGPGGQKTILMSDVCGVGEPLTGAGETFTFDDDAPAQLPITSSCAGLSGTFKPSDFDNLDGDMFAAPAPAGPHALALSVFGASPPNGLWQLFVADDVEGQNGSIARGWSLELLPSARCAGKAAGRATGVGTSGKDTLIGTPGADVMLGLGGKDTISGLGGNDVICGGPGKDKVKGGPGKDLLLGQGGKDALIGQGGKDTCKGGGKPDTAKSCEKQKSI